MKDESSKLEAMLEAMKSNDWARAISIAAKFKRLGEQHRAIQRAHTAYFDQRMASQLFSDIEKVKAEGRAALVARFTDA